MDIYTLYAVSVFQVVGNVIILRIFLEIFGERLKQKRLSEYALWATLVLGNCLLAYFMKETLLLKQASIILYTSFVIQYLFRLKFRRILVLMMLYQAVNIVVEYLELVFMGYFSGISEGRMGFAMSGIIILQDAIVFGLVLMIKRFFSGKKSAGKENLLTDREWGVFSVFPLFTIIVILVIYKNFGVRQADSSNVMLCVACGLAAMNVVMFYLLNGIAKRERQIAEHRLFDQKMDNQTKEYYSILENYENQRKRIHEFKNHMSALLALAKQEETCTNHLQEKLKAYLEGMQEENLKLLDNIDTNHTLINAILNSKYQEAKNKGITFVIKINDLSGVFLSDQDLVVILYNLLNNAFEACEKCEKKVVWIKFVQEQGEILLAVMNTSKGAPTKSGGRFLTDKEDRNSHGVGVENVKETVKKYGGTCAIKYEKQMFKFIIIIPTKIVDC